MAPTPSVRNLKTPTPSVRNIMGPKLNQSQNVDNERINKTRIQLMKEYGEKVRTDNKSVRPQSPPKLAGLKFIKPKEQLNKITEVSKSIVSKEESD